MAKLSMADGKPIKTEINYTPGFLCPDCKRDRLELRGPTDSGLYRSYCKNCGFWDWLEDI